MREITQFENLTLEIWRRPYQRSMNLTVRPNGSLRVTCGRRLARREILRFVRDSEDFISRRLAEFEDLQNRFPPKQYLSGELFLFFGRSMPLEVVWSWNERLKVEVCEQALELIAPLHATRECRGEALNTFFRRQARSHFDDRLRIFSKRMGLFPSGVSVRGQNTRWGSCSGRGEISLNWKLLAAPLDVIDYVIIHELAHLQHANHSSAFWRLVGAFHPDYRHSRAWLREHEFEISQQFPSF